MKTIQVQLGDRSYPIHIKPGLTIDIPSILSGKNNGQKWVIITQHRIMELFGFDLITNLKDNGFDVEYITVPMGEASKSLNDFSSLISQMIELNCDRSTTILALGGGTVGDVAGFVASSFMRGIKYYQIPTTLLAMVDSSIGGKTGINIAEGKNLIGSIYQPQGVLVDSTLLDSLPREEVISGLGEVIKYGAIRDTNFLKQISNWLNDIDSFPFDKAVERSSEIKADIVSLDERESGFRRLLNFGHTVGHALEAYLGYGKIRHGEAVALGMKCAGWISEKMDLLSNDEFNQLVEPILKLPLPSLGKLNANHIMPYIQVDKKSEKGVLNFVVLDGLGNGITSTHVTEKLIQQSLKVLN